MTKIAWTDESWNPIVGCSKVSAGCANCYAERMANRLAHMGIEQYQAVLHEQFDEDAGGNRFLDGYGGWDGRTAFVESALEKPLHWKKPRMIFVCSMGDLFHESVPFKWIDQVISIISRCPQHTFQILTKRADRMVEYFNDVKKAGLGSDGKATERGKKFIYKKEVDWPLKNLWLGVSAEDQATFDDRVPVLLEIPAAVRFVSCEPLLGPILLSGASDKTCYYEPDWVIVGAESGLGRRRCERAWVDGIVDQCDRDGVPCFVKQVHDERMAVVHNPPGYPQAFPKTV